jgi:hypothetical protein
VPLDDDPKLLGQLAAENCGRLGTVGAQNNADTNGSITIFKSR